MEKFGYVYILTNKGRNVLYIGVTSDIVGRVAEHREGIYEKSFTKRYNVKHLVYWEQVELITDAIAREKELKTWRRNRKIHLIEIMNPEMIDLYNEKFCEEHY